MLIKHSPLDGGYQLVARYDSSLSLSEVDQSVGTGSSASLSNRNELCP